MNAQTWKSKRNVGGTAKVISKFGMRAAFPTLQTKVTHSQNTSKHKIEYQQERLNLERKNENKEDPSK
jgi:hypothetical protein